MFNVVLSSVANKFGRRRWPASRFTKTLLSLIIADVLFLLFMTFGYAFPSKMALPDPQKALAEAEYDYSAKASPFVVPQKLRKSE
jgi:hypothetical protein